MTDPGTEVLRITLICYLILKPVTLATDCLGEQRNPVFTEQLSLSNMSGYYSTHVPVWMASLGRRGSTGLYLCGSCSSWSGHYCMGQSDNPYLL